MSSPWSICLEDLDAPEGRGFLRCVALVGRQPGLRLDDEGRVLWKAPEGRCELWVSADDRLILYREVGGPATTVSRSQRSLAVPDSKPVVLIDQDEIAIGGRRLRVHVHGEAGFEHAPEALEPPRSAMRVIAKVATAAALGAAALAGIIEVRANPPGPPAMQPVIPESTIGGPPDAGSPDGGRADAGSKRGRPSPPIDVRETPPADVPPEVKRPVTPPIELREAPPAPPIQRPIVNDNQPLVPSPEKTPKK